MKRLLPLLIAVALTMPAMAQNIYLKDGTVITTKGVRRAGDDIMASVDLPSPQPGQAPISGELGYAIAQISKIDFPQPDALNTAPGLINSGNPAGALEQLQPVLAYYNGFGDVPGSWWAQATVLDIQALNRMGRYDDAENLASQMAHAAANPESARAADVYLAAGMARRGDYARAMQIYDEILNEGSRPETLAPAAVNKGLGHLARQEWEDALLALLQVPVFYPQEQVLMPDVLLGSAQAYIGLRDFTRAKTALDELTNTYAQTPQAAQAQAEMKRLVRLQEALAPQK
jgi:tetratricopeptide (TPR) repeat protein